MIHFDNRMKQAVLFPSLLLGNHTLFAAQNPVSLYQQHCMTCHGTDRLGGTGPALFPQNLERLKKPEALRVITEGRAATQMPAFKDKILPEDIAALADFIYTTPQQAPIWGESEIRASRVETAEKTPLSDRPVFQADPLNLFVVVEAGDHHVTILDGDKLEPIHRFPSRFALHGGPKFTPDGRYVFFASRDGWLSKFDIYNLKTLTEVRAGVNTRNLAVSSDGQYVLAGNYLPHSLALFDANLHLIKLIPVLGTDGKKTSRVSAVYDAAPRKSFIVALKDIPEVWEISYDKGAAPVYKGLVHDYKMGEGLAAPGQFTPKQIVLDSILDDFFFDQQYDHLIGASREGQAQVINLNVRRKIADLTIPGMPHLGSGITWMREGRPLLATPNLKEGKISVIDMRDWKVIQQIETLGPGFFIRSHEKTPFAWTDSMMSPAKDTLQVFDKEKLTIVAQLKPAPGKTLAHVEFTRDGKYVLASLWEDEGALIVFDAATFQEMKRIPMRKPVGKYNVYNKITRSEGTSH